MWPKQFNDSMELILANGVPLPLVLMVGLLFSAVLQHIPDAYYGHKMLQDIEVC